LNLLLGAGDVGKGLLVAWIVARLTRGELPGKFYGRPIELLIVAHEDARKRVWDPRITAAGGDLSRVHYLDYTPDLDRKERVPFEFNKHIERLEQLLVGLDLQGVFFDQVLDHFSPTSEGMMPGETRRELHQLADLVQETDRFGIFNAHPNKGHGRSIRQLVGGSHQFVEVARTGSVLAYHPDEEHVRVLVLDKGNNLAPRRQGLRFRIDGASVIAGDTGRMVRTSQIVDIREEEEGLTLRDLSIDPITERGPGPTKKGQCESAIIELLADGDWHERSELVEYCCDELDFTESTFKRVLADVPLEHRRDETKQGKPASYRLRRRDGSETDSGE
jgi:AAA domain